MEETQRVICVGDIHGHLKKLESLWGNLRAHLGDEKLDKAVIVFLGDLCDRGPQTKEVLEWIVQLKRTREEKKRENTQEKPTKGEKRKWEEGEVVILAGNHDIGFASFAGSPPYDSDSFSEEEIERSSNPDFTAGFFTHPVDKGMHYYGRRWGGSERYSAGATFRSYGCNFNSVQEVKAREKFIACVPPSHHNLLKNLEWVYDIEVSWGPKRIICVHAGLPELEEKQLEECIRALSHREVLNECLQPTEFGYFQCLSGRGQVICPPNCLVGKAVVVSGHHGARRITRGRVIIDTSGGRFGIPLEGMIFPECEIVKSGNHPIEKVTGV